MTDAARQILALFPDKQDSFMPSVPPLAIGYVTFDRGTLTLSGHLRKRDTTPWLKWTKWRELHLSGQRDGELIYTCPDLTVPVQPDLLADPAPETLHVGIGHLR